MPVKHKYQSGRADNGDAGAVQPSEWNDEHDLTGMLALLDNLAPTPNVVVTLDGSMNLQLKATAEFAPTFSPNFTGVPLAPTPNKALAGNQVATMEVVHTLITDLIGGAPGALDTLNELALAINDDASFAASVTASLAVRLRVDAVQGLTSGQKAQGVANLGLATVAVSGNYADLAGKPTLGTAAALNVGAAANQVVQLDATGKLPAVDGSQLTNVNFAGVVRYDAAQALTAAQQAQARANAGVAGRNRIINGGFIINQRAYASGTALAAGVYAHDRWKAGAAGCTYTFAQSGGPFTSITVTAGSLQQIIEGGNIEGGTYTLSWGGTAQGRVNGGAYSVSPLTVTGLAAGSNVTVEFNAGTLGAVQFEAGSSATPFEFRSISAELMLCQRYYETGFARFLGTTTVAGNTVGYSRPFAVPKRAVPTITTSNFVNSANASGVSSVVTSTQTIDSAILGVTSSAANVNTDGQFNFQATAEL